MNTHRRSASRNRINSAAALVIAALLAPGCAPKSEPTLSETSTAEQQAAQPAGDEAIAYDADALQPLVESIQQKALALPGRTTEEHRDAMRAVFDDLIQLLPILEGPEPSGQFRQQLRTLTSARDRLTEDASPSTVNASIDAGLRAVTAALEHVGADEPFASDATKDLIAKLNAKVDELDSIRAIGRPYVTTEAVALIGGVARQMYDELPASGAITAESIESAGGPEIEATRPPEPAPTTEPATEPAPAPDAAIEATRETTAEPAPEPAPTPEPAPEPAAEPVPGPAPAPEPAPDPAAEPAPAPEPAPEPEPAPAPSEELNK